MIIKIDSKHRDALKECCALTNYAVRFFTVENNPLTTQAEIFEPNGMDLKARDAFNLGRIFAMEIDMRDLKALS